MSLHFILLSVIGLWFLWSIWYIKKIFGCPSKTCFTTFDLTDFESTWYRFIFSILKLTPFCLIWRYKFMFFFHKHRLWLTYPYFWWFYCLIGKGKTFAFFPLKLLFGINYESYKRAKKTRLASLLISGKKLPIIKEQLRVECIPDPQKK